MGPSSWPRLLAGFALIFVVYQGAEGLQTVIAPASPAGPTLMLAALVLAWPVGRWLGGRGYDRFGLSLKPGWWAILLGGIGLAALAKLASLSLGLQTGVYSVSGTPYALTIAAIAAALMTTFVPSVAEDILTRGFLLGAAPVRLGFWSYTLLSALLYTANHIWRFDWGISEQIRLFCLGLAYGAAAWRWQSLWGAIALHWGWNLASVLADGMVATQTVDVVGGRMISAGAHLALLVVVLLSAGGGKRPAERLPI
jgi:membrane protease YdiL (CAAX protease family)